MIDTSGSRQDEEAGIREIVEYLADNFDTQTAVKISIVDVGDSTNSQINVVLGPAGFNSNSDILAAYDNSMTWYEQTTAIGGGMTLGAQQLDTNDDVPDAMIVITDGWDGQLGELQTAAAAISSSGITTLAVGYDPSGFISTSTLEDIAAGDSNNVFTAVDQSTLDALKDQLFSTLCGVTSRRLISTWSPRPIINKFVWQAASKYKNKFNSLPSWVPGYSAWKAGEKFPFVYERE